MLCVLGFSLDISNMTWAPSARPSSSIDREVEFNNTQPSFLKASPSCSSTPLKCQTRAAPSL